MVCFIHLSFYLNFSYFFNFYDFIEFIHSLLNKLFNLLIYEFIISKDLFIHFLLKIKIIN